MLKKWLFIAPLLILLLVLTACSTEKQHTRGSDQLSIYTSVYPIKYLAEQIGGKTVDVHSIYPPGSDAHSFEPTQQDMMKLADSDFFFYIGLGMEGFVTKAKETLKNDHVHFVPLAEKLDLPPDPTVKKDEDDHHHGDINPHVWLNPVYMESMAAIVRDQLIKAKPDQKTVFEKNYQETISKLKKLDQSFREVTKTAKHKDFVVPHAAYTYWETEYGLKQIPIAGIETSDEPSQKKLQQIVETIKAKKIPYLLLEQNTHSKIANVIQQETNTKTLKLHNLETLTQKDIDQKRDYISIMNDNLKALKKALNY
ncbi:metal ABC transporter substrate-binding protein [Listeria sp. PSOL-1]|uniref:metal ABC transporter substrate-binding protein n=1 Tax=Listeria sp. PSOL-1 TaxID=1844999 RepID=UPI0013D22EB1|nr:metal ABC transporter substrate-binding protein [Listeria sp. PSOL-1]